MTFVVRLTDVDCLPRFGLVVSPWRIDEVALRRAGLVLRWVTVRGYTVLVFNQATQAN